MVAENSKAVFVAMTIIIGISAAAFLSMFNSGNPVVVPNTSGVSTLAICGNSTDLLYPELMDASFVFLENGSWLVNACFVNDSIDWYDNLEIYDLDFTVTSEEVKSIDDALYEGLNKTFPSDTSAMTLLDNSCPHIWYQIEITYTDGSWIFITTFQTEIGHIITSSGTDTLDTNLLSGIVLEPLSALDCLVSAIHTVFSNHLG